MKKSKVSVKQTKDKDLILDLNKKIFPADPLQILPGDLCWILTINDEPLGFATMRILVGTEEYPLFAYMNRAGIMRKARGNKYHRKLIDVRLKYCKKHFVSKVITYTINDNYQSINGLIDKGFRLYAPEWAYADDVTYLYMNIK